ncbi:hypothetical protein K503DRAFT_765034 [Rhizopogon vinicolor AM-OR11-026]|uniref:Zn(2)-C6 fungal-type domain-containing protein n=1 Tax=Rhizopogon vinicolor AM-OR11-026 TaxID=1314800 RepID=A0A1B7NHS3_9AGAM|nr:hypothetical protein K503DRAFT_765034 [Rhizopogon vinicolor AM-OR11-026]
MDPASSAAHVQHKKQDDDLNKSVDKRDVKPVVKTLNRVPRACNACRKQKMRCEGADNPPCRRCRHAGLECLFEKPTREATLTGEAGLERIRSLEAHVAEIRFTQSSIQNTLLEIVGYLRGATPYNNRSPSTFSQPPYSAQSPTIQSPSVSAGPNGSHVGDPNIHSLQTGPTTPTAYQSHHGSLTPMLNPPPRHSRGSLSQSSLTSAGQHSGHAEYHPPQLPPSHTNPTSPTQRYGYSPSGQVLPPFSTLQSIGHTASRGSVPGSHDSLQQRRMQRGHEIQSPSGSKRTAPSSSNATSADSTDIEDDNGELPASGLVAPWEVLRGLADVAIERAAKENGEASSEPQSRTRTPSPERQFRPTKRRKIRHRVSRGLTFMDVVTMNIIPEQEARELFRIFYAGCSTFLPVFDCQVDTFEALHERSPFAVDAICMVAARVKDGGGNASETYLQCLDAVQNISCATLFAPVNRIESVQAMILVSGWSDNGWLSGGHAVRMAMELSLHKAWPKLLRRMQSKTKSTNGSEDRDLVVASRTWFCLYLFEHQLSYGTGRPAILKDDESIWQCRLLLQHPLAIEDDMRLVSTVELMAIRERVTNNLSPFERPVDEVTFAVIQQADSEFRNWYKTWDHAFSQKYEDAAFYRQSLQIQHLHAELFHSATALRGINGPEDVQKMPVTQRELAIRSIRTARQGLEITVNSPSYSEGMKYAVHYTHATATFAASFLLRLARLFPNDCDVQEIRSQVERLAGLMSRIPGKRYAITLQLMLKRAKKRKSASTSRSPQIPKEPHRNMSMVVDMQQNMHMNSEHFAHKYETTSIPSPEVMQQMQMGMMPQQTAEVDSIWRGFEMTSNEQLPVWISDQSLGGNTFSQQGMDAFLLPTDYLPSAPQIW